MSKHIANQMELADELMAMAPTVAAATAEGGAAVLREAAYQLRICNGLIDALRDIAKQWPDSAAAKTARAAIAKAEGRS